MEIKKDGLPIKTEVEIKCPCCTAELLVTNDDFEKRFGKSIIVIDENYNKFTKCTYCEARIPISKKDWLLQPKSIENGYC